jgi:hypothetical protein
MTARIILAATVALCVAVVLIHARRSTRYLLAPDDSWPELWSDCHPQDVWEGR